MPKVVDAARVTTRVNTVWRTCSGCDQIKALRRGVKRCATCTQVLERHALNGWEHAQRYAALIGRIEAWTLLIPDVSDAERLDHIRQALATFDQVVPAEAVG